MTTRQIIRNIYIAWREAGRIAREHGLTTWERITLARGLYGYLPVRRWESWAEDETDAAYCDLIWRTCLQRRGGTHV